MGVDRENFDQNLNKVVEVMNTFENNSLMSNYRLEKLTYAYLFELLLFGWALSSQIICSLNIMLHFVSPFSGSH